MVEFGDKIGLPILGLETPFEGDQLIDDGKSPYIFAW